MMNKDANILKICRRWKGVIMTGIKFAFWACLVHVDLHFFSKQKLTRFDSINCKYLFLLILLLWLHILDFSSNQLIFSLPQQPFGLLKQKFKHFIYHF